MACLMKLLCALLGSYSDAFSLAWMKGVVCELVLRWKSISLIRLWICVQKRDLLPCPSRCLGRKMSCFGCLRECLRFLFRLWAKCASNFAAVLSAMCEHRGLKVLRERIRVFWSVMVVWLLRAALDMVFSLVWSFAIVMVGVWVVCAMAFMCVPRCL